MNVSEQANPDISFIVPVLNESQRINSFLRHLKEQTAEKKTEIIIVDGANDGGTIKAINDSDVIRLAGPKGRAKQMNAGAAAARGRILLFLHADTKLPTTALTEILDTMKEKKYVAGAFEIDYESQSPLMSFIAWRSNLRCRITRIPYGDQGIFIRRDYFEQIGGFREYDLLEDVDLMRRIKHEGGKIRILKSRLKVSPRRWQKEGFLYCMIRNHIIIILYFFGVHPDKLARLYKN